MLCWGPSSAFPTRPCPFSCSRQFVLHSPCPGPSPGRFGSSSVPASISTGSFSRQPPLAAPGCISELRSALVYRALTQPPLCPSSRPLSHFFKIKFGRSKAACPAPARPAAPRLPPRFQRPPRRRIRARVSSSERAGGGRLQRPVPLANMVLAAPERPAARPACPALVCPAGVTPKFLPGLAGPSLPLFTASF